MLLLRAFTVSTKLYVIVGALNTTPSVVCPVEFTDPMTVAFEPTTEELVVRKEETLGVPVVFGIPRSAGSVIDGVNVVGSVTTEVLPFTVPVNTLSAD